MRTKYVIPAIALVTVLMSACATQATPGQVSPGQQPLTSTSVAELGTSLAKNYLRTSPMPATVVVAPAVKHDGQLRPSFYGETLATLISGALVNAGVPVIQTDANGWTSGQPVNVVARRRAEAVNAGLIAFGSYHHVDGITLVSYRLVDIRTGSVIAVSDARVGGGQ